MALFVLSFCPFDISVGEGAFVIELVQISSFLSLFSLGSEKHSARYGLNVFNVPILL